MLTVWYPLSPSCSMVRKELQLVEPCRLVKTQRYRPAMSLVNSPKTSVWTIPTKDSSIDVYHVSRKNLLISDIKKCQRVPHRSAWNVYIKTGKYSGVKTQNVRPFVKVRKKNQTRWDIVRLAPVENHRYFQSLKAVKINSIPRLKNLISFSLDSRTGLSLWYQATVGTGKVFPIRISSTAGSPRGHCRSCRGCKNKGVSCICIETKVTRQMPRGC